MTLLQTIFKKRKVHTISNIKQNVIETWCDSLLSINLIGWKLPRRRLVVSAGLWLSSRIAHVSMKSFPWPFIRRRHNDVHRTLSIPGRLGNQDVVFTGLDRCIVGFVEQVIFPRFSILWWVALLLPTRWGLFAHICITKWTQDVIIPSLLRQNDVATSLDEKMALLLRRESTGQWTLLH